MICGNCLNRGARWVEVGPDKGSQRDPHREQVPLCEECEDYLTAGRFDMLAINQRDERTVRCEGE